MDLYLIDHLSIVEHLTEPFTTLIYCEWSLENTMKYLISRMRKKNNFYYVGNHKNKEHIEKQMNIETTYVKHIHINEKEVNRTICILPTKAYSILVKSTSTVQPRRY